MKIFLSLARIVAPVSVVILFFVTVFALIDAWTLP